MDICNNGRGGAINMQPRPASLGWISRTLCWGRKLVSRHTYPRSQLPNILKVTKLYRWINISGGQQLGGDRSGAAVNFLWLHQVAGIENLSRGGLKKKWVYILVCVAQSPGAEWADAWPLAPLPVCGSSGSAPLSDRPYWAARQERWDMGRAASDPECPRRLETSGPPFRPLSPGALPKENPVPGRRHVGRGGQTLSVAHSCLPRCQPGRLLADSRLFMQPESPSN